MAVVSTKHFYFERFGGYSGLSYALAADLVEIPDLSDGELIGPGTYWNCQVNEIVSHGHGRYTVEFTNSDGSRLTYYQCTQRQLKFKLGDTVDVLMQAKDLDKRHYAGTLMGKFYLIAPGGHIEAEFETVKALRTYCREEGILDTLQGIHVHDIRHSRTNNSSEADQS